jgi:hypothetical protein
MPPDQQRDRPAAYVLERRPAEQITPEAARAAVLEGKTVRVVIGPDPEDPTVLIYIDHSRENGGEPMIYCEPVRGWSAGIKEAVCKPEDLFFLEFVADPPPLSITITDQEPPQREAYGAACDDCAEHIEAQRSELPGLDGAALHIAVGALYGGGPCDHVDYTLEDEARAYEALWHHALRQREHLRAALSQALASIRSGRVGHIGPISVYTPQVDIDRVTAWQAVADRVPAGNPALKALVALLANESVRTAATPEQIELARAAGWKARDAGR